MHDNKDILEIEFKNPYYIVDSETGDEIKPRTIIRNRIPKQMPADRLTIMLQKLGPTVKNVLSSLIVGNFAIQLLMAASL